MENLLQRQQSIVEAIKKIESNFNKDGASRKTRKYLNDRLDALDKLWADFQSNHYKLSAYENDSDPYFVEDQFTSMRSYFDAVRKKISSFPPTPTEQALLSPLPSPKPETSINVPVRPLRSASTVPDTEQSTPALGRVDELLSQQRTNFRALNRQVKGLNVDDLRDKWEIEDELRSVQKRWETIDTLHLQIDNILQGSDPQYDGEFQTNEDVYKKVKRALNQKLASTSHLQQQTPHIEIPTFTGKYTQWPTFYDLYVESIHENNLLTKCQKMQHLKGRVRGDAERLIQHLHISADNYDTAWELLTHRYNNPQLLFTKQVELFLNQPTANKQSAFEIRRLYDTSMECIHAIQNLGIDTSTWDPLLVHLISKKLDSETYGDYKEARKSPRDLPPLSELMDFLEGKFTALEPINKKDKESTTGKPTQQKTNKPNFQQQGGYRPGKYSIKEHKTSTVCATSCPLCNNDHYLLKCSKFLKLSPDERLMTVIKLDCCQNCLYSHNDKTCTSKKMCRVCQKHHHTILHDAYTYVDPNEHMSSKLGESAGSSLIHIAPVTNKTQTQTQQQQRKLHSINHVATDDEEILLTTLSIKVKAADGTYVTLRALLDQGSQISLISENAAQMLGLPRQRFHASVTGIGNGTKHGKSVVSLECQSIYEDYDFTTQALVIARVINNLPNISFNKQSWPHLQHIQLADPEYNVSKKIDLLLDASIYSDIIMSGLIKASNMAPIAQQTKLGWILSGSVRTFNCHVVVNNLAELSQFWELEEIEKQADEITQDELYCENLYQSTTKRLVTGRYEVAIPMKPNFKENLGQSKSKAVAQFYNLENKMARNAEFSKNYQLFMQDYEQQGHMRPVTEHNVTSCYLPHHGVLKLDSTTTKQRTVFNASSKTFSGYSLNDLMERGPNLQKDLHHLILVWRQYKYVITADIEKMFRQIAVRESDQHLQRIVWRNSPADPLMEYQLTTVTYGTKSAPYLAMRTLKQLAIDDANKFPKAAAALMSSFYMDDLLEGSNDIIDAKQLQLEIIESLKGAGMNIRKWSSNNKELTQNLTAEQLDKPLDFKNSESKKTLGLRWNPTTDTFTFQNQFQDETSNNCPTKRQLLSNISKIFDPMGWLSSLTVRAKFLFQQTWSQQTSDWDKLVTDVIHKQWIQLRSDFQKIEHFQIPRFVGEKDYVIHGFCDASEKAYACAIYVVSLNSKGEFTSTLVTAKTKLAPLKNKQSLPRLELCGALLLSRLMKKVKEAWPKQEAAHTFAWTDSMVVLGWLQGDTNRWKQFVANRVSTILSIIPSSSWHHVRSEDNAADCATRGLTSQQLSEYSLWWQGPQWLTTFDKETLQQNTYQSPAIEIKKINVNAALAYENDLITKLLNDCSSTRRITTTICWLSRFTRWLRNKQAPQQKYLSTSELQRALNLTIRTVQTIEFENDIHQLEKENHLNKGSKLISLNPYIDSNDGLLKVGGRLNNSLLSPAAKHPIILPSYSKLTELIIRQAHHTTLHGGPSSTLAYIRERYWILSGLRTVKRELRKCVTCRRFKEEKRTQIMGELPEPRVTPSRPFSHCGVDFTGHFDIKANKGRGVRTHKGYVAVFVCLSTKAVHLELVSDLSTPGFLAALRRFCARRGVPKHMYSDQGRNFIGADSSLKKEYKQILQTIDGVLLSKINDYDIQWHFNAPAYPSAGGLWEAAVKSLKHHLRRVIGEQKLTYEEFITLLHQIEAVLNSRPLLRLSEDLDDEYLCPGNFLIGTSMISRPQTDSDHMSLTTRWHLIQAMNKQFWRKWSSDYLQQLQTRAKWRTPSTNLEVEDIVLIKDENLPPGKWAMGRIIEVHPGKDGYVRVVSVKTKNGTIRRPIIKLSPLPVKYESSQQQSQVNKTTRDDVTSQAPIKASPTGGRSSRTGKGSLKTLFTMAMLLFLAFCTPGQCSYRISTLSNDKNIYFDKMYDMNIIRDDWKLIVYYNMSTYWTGLQDMQNYVNHLEGYLHTTETDLPIQYKSIIYQLQHELSELNHYNQILTGQPTKRPKRGFVNGIGNLANALFGVLDDQFAKRYEKDITKISMNENHLKLLLKNQTSVIEAQANIMQRNEDIMNKQFGIVQKYLQNMTTSSNRLQKINSDELHILSASMSAVIIISHLQNIQEEIISTVTDLTHGHMNTHLLPPDQLEEQLNKIYSHLPSDLTLPADKRDYNEIYRLMKVKGRVFGSYLIIEVRIPLINKESYELDKIISLPQQFFTIEFITPYIAYNLQKDLFITFTEAEIQNCITVQTNKLLCHIERPIYMTQLSQSICNLKPLNKTMCHTTNAPCHERWIKLHNSNRWLYSCCGKCTIRIFCTDIGLNIKTLAGNGLLDMSRDCTIKSDTFHILGHNDYLSHVKVQDDILIDPETSVLNSMLNFSVIEFSPENHGDEWQRMSKQISILKEQEDAPLTVHDVHQFAVLYTILGLSVIVLSMYIYRRWRSHTPIIPATSKTSATPAPAVADHIELKDRVPGSRPRRQSSSSLRLDIPSADNITYV